MTATQVFLRFVKSQYTKENGEHDAKKYRLWMLAMSSSKIYQRKSHFWLREYNDKRSFVRSEKSNEKDHIDRFLRAHGRSLRGYLRCLIESETSFWYPNWNLTALCASYDVRGNICFNRKKQGMEKLLKEWYSFVDNHIVGETTKRWSIKRPNYTFEWKE